MITIILVSPKNPGNIGAVCRAMANFGLSRLMVVEPECDIKNIELAKRAKHSKGVVSIITGKKANLKEFDYLIGTTARLGTDYNIPRSPLTPEQLAGKISRAEGNTGIMFGREDHGLTNKEIAECDFVVSIPTSEKYHAMNISHAVAIICYEIFKHRTGGSFRQYPAAGKAEKAALLRKINKMLDKMKFSTKEKKTTQQIVWRRILGKSFLTQREIYALHGFFEKLRKF